MPRKPPPPPPDISPERVHIAVYPFGDSRPIPAWITSGCLDCVAGAPSRRARVEIGPAIASPTGEADMAMAARCVARQKYTDAWVVHASGSRSRLTPP